MLAVNSVQIFLLLSYLIFLAVSGSLLFAGADILMCLFILSTADMFLVMAASSDSSPFSTLGAGREMIQIMAYEPMTLLLAVGFYLATGSFQVADIIRQPVSAVVTMPGFLVGLMFTMAIKLRKSPFDLSTSHHAHQEIVKGLTTEMAGPALAVMNIAEYYEVTLMLAWWRCSSSTAIRSAGRGRRRLPAGVFPGDPVGQRQRPRQVEGAAGRLLGVHPADRRPERSDPHAGPIRGRTQ